MSEFIHISDTPLFQQLIEEFAERGVKYESLLKDSPVAQTNRVRPYVTPDTETIPREEIRVENDKIWEHKMGLDIPDETSKKQETFYRSLAGLPTEGDETNGEDREVFVVRESVSVREIMDLKSDLDSSITLSLEQKVRGILKDNPGAIVEDSDAEVDSRFQVVNFVVRGTKPKGSTPTRQKFEIRESVRMEDLISNILHPSRDVQNFIEKMKGSYAEGRFGVVFDDISVETLRDSDMVVFTVKGSEEITPPMGPQISASFSETSKKALQGFVDGIQSSMIKAGPVAESLSWPIGSPFGRGENKSRLEHHKEVQKAAEQISLEGFDIVGYLRGEMEKVLEAEGPGSFIDEIDYETDENGEYKIVFGGWKPSKVEEDKLRPAGDFDKPEDSEEVFMKPKFWEIDDED